MTFRKALLALVAAALVLPAPARADDPIDQVGGDTPLAGYLGWSAWSRTEGDRFRLVLRDPRGTMVVPQLPTSSRPWDVSLGPDADRDVVAIYQRCTARGCDLRRLSVDTGREETLDGASSPRFREATPAIWRNTVAFTRRVGSCDVPYVKTLGSTRPSRRLLRKCLRIAAGHLAIRGTRIFTSGLDLDEADENLAGRKVSEIRRYSSTRSGSEVILSQGFGEESNLFGQIAIDESHLTTVKVGVREPHAFVRVRTVGGTPAVSRAHLTLTGAFAKVSPGGSLYLQAQDGEGDSCGRVPCRVILSSTSPFGRVVRLLPPEITVAYATDRPGRPRQNEPLPFRGILARKVVGDGEVLRVDPLPGVAVELRRRTLEERFEPTPYRGVTGPDGRYEIVVPPPVPREPWFTAVAATDIPTWAGRGTVGQSAP